MKAFLTPDQLEMSFEGMGQKLKNNNNNKPEIK